MMRAPDPAGSGTLILVRHGRTAGNGQCHVGWLDLPLDDLGVSQARHAAELLRDYPVAAVYSSSLQRATATAQAILDEHAGLAMHCHDGLREIDYGDYTGRRKDGPPLKLRHHHVEQAMPGGESLMDVDRRVAALLPVLLAPLALGRTVVVVAHFWSLRLLLGRLRGLGLREMLATRDYKPANGSVHVLPVHVLPAHVGPVTVGRAEPAPAVLCGPLSALTPEPDPAAPELPA